MRVSVCKVRRDRSVAAGNTIRLVRRFVADDIDVIVLEYQLRIRYTAAWILDIPPALQAIRRQSDGSICIFALIGFDRDIACARDLADIYRRIGVQRTDREAVHAITINTSHESCPHVARIRAAHYSIAATIGNDDCAAARNYAAAEFQDAVDRQRAAGFYVESSAVDDQIGQHNVTRSDVDRART